MEKSKDLFWNVDTQVDFVEPNGKLYVQGAERLRPNWKKLTEFAKSNNIRVVNTCDWHNPDSNELSDTPDFVTTFPTHCMANTVGADFVAESKPENSTVIPWEGKLDITTELVLKTRNITIQKDAFDVFAGNPYSSSIVEILNPDKVIVYGVTTNVCVNDAVLGLAKRVEELYVIEDAIKELPNIPLPFEKWDKLGVRRIKLAELETVLARK